MPVAELIRSVTPEELLNMPDNGSMELVDGQIVEKQVSAESSQIELQFGIEFGFYLRKNPIGRAYPASLGYQCFPDDPDKVRKPDATVILNERLQKLSEPDPGFMPIVPDLAVEVISPNDTVYKVDEKMSEYQDAGFPLIWLADPKARTVTVLPLHGRPSILTGDDEITAESVLPGFRCKVSDFFPSPVPAP